MSGSLRLFLVIAALLVLVFIVRKIRKSQIQVIDSVFWFLFAGSFVVLAVIPEIAYTISDALGFVSPSNFILLYVIGIVVVKEFSLTVQLAKLRTQQNKLIQELALRNACPDRHETSESQQPDDSRA